MLLVASIVQPARIGLLAIAGAALFLGGCATTTTSTGPVSQTVFDSKSDYIVQAEARGRPLRLKVDPGAPFFIVLNDKVAKELHLVGTKAATLAVGPMRLKASTRNEKMTIGGVTASKPVMWVKGQSLRDVDGIINPANLPGDRITLQMQAPQPNEQLIELPMKFDRQRGLYYEFDYGGQLILDSFHARRSADDNDRGCGFSHCQATQWAVGRRTVHAPSPLWDCPSVAANGSW